MIATRCPRCGRVWYPKANPTAWPGLCPDCLDAQNRTRPRVPGPIDAFLITTAALVVLDLILIGSTALWPVTFGQVIWYYGFLLALGGFFAPQAWEYLKDYGKPFGMGQEKLDWTIKRWPVMFALVGLACIGAYYSLGVPARLEEYALRPANNPTMPPPALRYPAGNAAPILLTRPPPDKVPSASELPGLLGYWSFDDDRHAPKVPDVSGRHNDAETSGAAWAEGVRGKALAFNGRGVSLNYGAGADFNFAAEAPFTLACWVWTRSASGVILGQRNGTDEGAVISLSVEQRRPCGTVRPDRGRDAARVVGRDPIDDGAWHHLAVTRGGNRGIELYVDGVSQGAGGAGVSKGPITTDMRTLGMEPRWARQGWTEFGGVRTYWDGAVDEFCIFGRLLNDEEVRKLAGR